MLRNHSGLRLLWTIEQILQESPFLDFGDIDSTDGGRYIGSLLRLYLLLCFSHWVPWFWWDEAWVRRANGVPSVQPMSRVSNLPIVNGHYWLRHSQGGARAQFLKAMRLKEPGSF